VKAGRQCDLHGAQRNGGVATTPYGGKARADSLARGAT
jgi:hypothetical protein